MCERFLPVSILMRASLRGNEYAWPLAAVEEVVTIAGTSRLANLGGQAQFRLPAGTYELSWLFLDSGERRPDEAWESYVSRSASEVLAQFAVLRERTDFLKEALQFSALARLHQAGVDLNQSLCFVLYFDCGEREEDSDCGRPNFSR